MYSIFFYTATLLLSDGVIGVCVEWCLAHIRAWERKTKEDDDKVVIEEEDHYKPINILN